MGKKLAIREHATRGKEVIELLQMMGGHATVINKISNETDKVFFISDNENCFYRKSIRFIHDSSQEMEEFNVFTLEEFLKEYPFKVGDKVHIYVQNDDTDGRYDVEVAEISSMRWNSSRCKIAYKMKDVNREFYKEEIKCKVDDNKLSGTVDNSAETKSCTVSLKAIEDSIDSVQFIQSGKIVAVRFNTQNYENEVELQLDDYEIVVRNGKTYAVLKKPAYPKTYEECCKITEDVADASLTCFACNLLNNFQKLLLCRDAYWEIAGEEMGLGKPWEPDWNNQRPKYTITVIGNQLIKHHSLSQNYILAFPTEEIRDIFYENFKDLIEQCKSLL